MVADTNALGKSGGSGRVVDSCDCVDGFFWVEFGPRVALSVLDRAEQVSPIFDTIECLVLGIGELENAISGESSFFCCCQSSLKHAWVG